jgi:hypothetical protein
MVVSNKEKIDGTRGVQAEEAQAEFSAFVVAGVASGAGKTALAETVTRLLSTRFPTAAAKITVTHGERGCPHGGKGCNVCGTLGGDFQVITKESVIMQSGTDTQRLSSAGAHPVLWTITREMHVADAWAQMKALMRTARCAVVESNTLALVIRPALTLMIVDPTASRRLWKPSAERLIREADVLVFNDRGPQGKRQSLLEEVERLRGPENLFFVPHPSGLEQNSAFKTMLETIVLNNSG